MLGILCGLDSEAKIARKIGGALVACAAARPHKARDLARELVAQGATRLISFGIAGSLDFSIGLGDIVVGTRVGWAGGGHMSCDEKWGWELAAGIAGAKRGGVYGSETLVATAAEKKALFDKTGCVIVDMESQCVAEAASEAGLPLAVLRAVCDAADMNVPPLVMAAIAEDGATDVPRALSHLARHPRQMADLYHVMRGTGQALKSLRLNWRAID